MAARRLIIVLILLLAASVIAASIAPDRTSQLVGVDPDTTEETTATTTDATTSTTTAEDSTSDDASTTPDSGAAQVQEEEDAGGLEPEQRIEASADKPETVRAVVGEQLTLLVGSDPARTVTILPLGLTAFAGDDAPARFDLLLRDAGTYAVTDIEDPGIALGRIKVREP